MKWIRRTILMLAAFCVIFVYLCACYTPEDRVPSTLGRFKNKEFYTSGGFQDYTDYGKYRFESVNVENNRYFSAVEEEDLETINAYLDDFEGWIDAVDPKSEVVSAYDFDRSIIDTSDYFCIFNHDDSVGKQHILNFESYNIYFLDTQTDIVYYFHNNI